MWPRHRTPDESAELEDVAATYGDLHCEMLALAGAIDAIARHEFGGEDFLPPRIRGLLDAVTAEAADFAARWADLAAGPSLWSTDEWPALAEPDPERQQERHAELVATFTDE